MVGFEPTTYGSGIEVTLYSTALLFNFYFSKIQNYLAVYMRIELISLGRQPRRITITPIDRYFLKKKRRKSQNLLCLACYPFALHRQFLSNDRTRTCNLQIPIEVWFCYGTFLMSLKFNRQKQTMCYKRIGFEPIITNWIEVTLLYGTIDIFYIFKKEEATNK